jgi:hypothetical protein
MRLMSNSLFGGMRDFSTDEEVRKENDHVWTSVTFEDPDPQEDKILKLELAVENLSNEVLGLKNLIMSLAIKDSTI